MTSVGSLIDLTWAWLMTASVTAAVLVPVAFVACWALKRRAPAARYQIWLYVLLAIALLPALRLGTPKVSLGVLPIPRDSAHTWESIQAPWAPKAAASPLAEPRGIPPTSGPDGSPAQSTWRWSHWLLAAWSAGVGVMLLRLLVGAVRLTRLRERAEPAPKEHLERVGITPTVPLLLSDEIEGPATSGVLRPVIVLPRGALDTPDGAALKMILEHEHAHIRRGDQVALWFQRLVEAAFFFHPFVWHASRELTREREFVCDHHVVRSGQSPTEYVKLLSRMIESGWGHSSAQATALFEGNLVSRVRSLLEGRLSGAPELAPRTRIASAVVLSALLLAFGTLRLEARASGSADPSPGGAPSPSAQAGEERPADDPLRQAMKPVVRAILEHRERLGALPRDLTVLGDGFAAVDPHSPTGQTFRYEPRRNAFVLSSCGPDGQHGSDDDLVLYFTEDRQYGGPRFGTRAEMSPLPDTDPEAQVEVATGRTRPAGSSSISGRVVSAANGEPLEHAMVYLFRMDTHEPLFLRVAQDGSFSYDDIAAGEYVLRTGRTAGYQDMTYDPEGTGSRMPRFVLAEGEDLTNIVFELKPAFSLSGRVLGDVPEGLLVLAVADRTEPEGLEIVGRGRPGPDGRYHIDALDGRPVYLQVADWRRLPSEGGYCPQYYPGTFSRDEAERITFTTAPEVSNLDIPLRSTGGLVLEGTVHDEDGAAVGGAHVVAHRSNMSFDLVPTYTDEEGRYQFQCLGKGDFLVHVDAVQHNLVRTRSSVAIVSSGDPTRLDFVLRRGVRVSGRLLGEQGQEWILASGFGAANVVTEQRSESSFTLTGFQNRNRTMNVRPASGTRFSPGEGDYGSATMIFPTESTFLLEGVAAGDTRIYFYPKSDGREVKSIRYEGRDIQETGLETKPGDEILDVVIVVGRVSS